MLKKLSFKELVLYATSAVIALVGLIFLILGVVADNLGIDSPLYKAQGGFPWRYLGLILISIAVVFAITVLCVFAKKTDRVADREARRKQRLNAMMSDIEKQEEIVVSDGKIIDEKKVVEEKEEEVETKPVQPIETKTEEPKIDQPVEKREEVVNNPTDNPSKNS